jgi:hypothetical protein
MGCPFQMGCAKGKETKTITVSLKNQKQRQEIREQLATEEGAAKYRKRQTEAEPVFGQIKHNQQFHRFSLRGLPKITLGMGSSLCCPQFEKMGLYDRSTSKEKEENPSIGGFSSIQIKNIIHMMEKEKRELFSKSHFTDLLSQPLCLS